MVRLEWDESALSQVLDDLGVQVTEDAGAAVADEARRLAPVRSGRLRDSIGVDIGTDSEGAYADVGADATDENGRPYPLFVEVGTKNAAAEPFLRPALDVIREQ